MLTEEFSECWLTDSLSVDWGILWVLTERFPECWLRNSLSVDWEIPWVLTEELFECWLRDSLNVDWGILWVLTERFPECWLRDFLSHNDVISLDVILKIYVAGSMLASVLAIEPSRNTLKVLKVYKSANRAFHMLNRFTYQEDDQANAVSTLGKHQ